ncbi:MAG: hypothetical protein JXB49_33735 [Bacteroidales bacterium]|nr:hypothetical protein [Bacteroidales bacterium]
MNKRSFSKKQIYRNYLQPGIKPVKLCLTLIYIAFLFIKCENENYPYYIQSSDHGVLWVANSADNTVTCINRLTDTEIGTFQVGPDPSRTAVDLNGNCWVGSRGDNSVYFVTKEGKTSRFEGFNAARGVALDQEGNVWIANSGNNTIQKISFPDTVISTQLDLPDQAAIYYGALIDKNNKLWILDRDAYTLICYDIERFPDPNAYQSLTLPGPIYGFTIDKNNTVWVSGYTSSALYKINGDSVILKETYQVPAELYGGSITGVTFDIYSNIWISNFNSNGVLRFNPTKKTFENFETRGTSPHGLGADDEGFIYTINRGSNNISKIDAKTGKFVCQYKVGNTPYTYSDLTGFIYRQVTLNKSLK